MFCFGIKWRKEYSPAIISIRWAKWVWGTKEKKPIKTHAKQIQHRANRAFIRLCSLKWQCKRAFCFSSTIIWIGQILFLQKKKLYDKIFNRFFWPCVCVFLTYTLTQNCCHYYSDPWPNTIRVIQERKTYKHPFSCTM